MDKKTLAIYFSEKDPNGYPFNAEWYFESYVNLISRVEKAGFVVVLVRANAYLGEGMWSCYSKIIDGQVQFFDTSVQSDLIFNRDNNQTIPIITDCPIIPQIEFDDLCRDKFQTAKVFSEISPKTTYIHSFEQFVDTMSVWSLGPEKKIVLKKNYLRGGEGIHILPVLQVVDSLYDDWTDVLVQEFHDSSQGIPGIVEGVHDLRIYVAQGKAVIAMIRTPKNGTLIANVALGGKSFSIDIDRVDQTVIEKISYIEKKICSYRSTLYGADFLRNEHGEYVLIELNSCVGVANPAWKQYNKVQKAFADLLIDRLHNLS